MTYMSEKPTVRDRVWSAALRLAVQDTDGFSADDVLNDDALDEQNRATVRRTLHAMQKLGWLEHRSGERRWWPGDKFEVQQIETRYRLDT